MHFFIFDLLSHFSDSLDSEVEVDSFGGRIAGSACLPPPGLGISLRGFRVEPIQRHAQLGVYYRGLTTTQGGMGTMQ